MWCKEISAKWSLCSPLVSKRRKVGWEIREKSREWWMSEFSLLFFQNQILKLKYLDNRLFKLWTVFIIEILTSRSLKLDLMLIDFVKLFSYTCRTTTLVLLVMYLLHGGLYCAYYAAELATRAELYLLRDCTCICLARLYFVLPTLLTRPGAKVHPKYTAVYFTNTTTNKNISENKRKSMQYNIL
jgi:hypothetical protein